MQMVGAGRECTDGNEELLEELAVGRVRPMEGRTDRRRLTNKFGVHPKFSDIVTSMAASAFGCGKRHRRFQCQRQDIKQTTDT